MALVSAGVSSDKAPLLVVLSLVVPDWPLPVSVVKPSNSGEAEVSLVKVMERVPWLQTLEALSWRTYTV
jgi:hypothetical protein